MKVKMLSRNPDDYERETKLDIHKMPRNYAPELHPFQQGREYVRAMNATKLERVFAKPFLGSLDGHLDGISCMAKNPKYLSVLLSGCYDGELRVWNLPRKHCVLNVQAHHGFLRGITADPNSHLFYTVGDDKTIKQWSLNFQSAASSTSRQDGGNITDPLFSIPLKGNLYDISHSWTQSHYATCGDVVQIWDSNRSAPLHEFQWGVDSVQKIRFNPIETDLLGAVAYDRSVILYDSRGGTPIRKVVMKLRSNALAWNPMEAFMFTLANEDYNLYTYDMRNLNAPSMIHMNHVSAVMDVDYCPTGRQFVSGSYDKTVRLWNVGNGRSRDIYHTKRMQRIHCILWSQDARFILSGSDEMNIRIWKATAWEKLGALRPREKLAQLYNEKLKERFGQHPEIKRIARHRQVPKHVFSAQKEMRVILQSQKRKEANRRIHSRPGSVPFVAERTKHVVEELE